MVSDLANNSSAETPTANDNNTTLIDNIAPKIAIAGSYIYESNFSNTYSNGAKTYTGAQHYNNTHASYNHKILYTLTISDTQTVTNLSGFYYLVDNGSTTSVNTSTNQAGNTKGDPSPNLLLSLTSQTAGEVSLVGATTSCKMTISAAYAISSTSFKQDLVVTDCKGSGTVGIRVAPGITLDLAHNQNSETVSSTTFVADNTAPTVSISAPTIYKNYTNKTLHFNNTHASDSHTIEFTLTIEDETKLLSDTNIQSSTNQAGNTQGVAPSPYVLLSLISQTSGELSVIGAKTGDNAGCVMTITTPETGTNTTITQVVTITGCSVETGTIQLQVNNYSTLDLAHNNNGFDVLGDCELSPVLADTVVKISLLPDATIEDVYNALNEKIVGYRDNPGGNFDDTARVLSYIPALLLKGVVALLRGMDYFGLIPKFLTDLSPFHCSYFITSMGSLGIPPIYHHRYDFGTCPVFFAFGAKRRVYEPDAEGVIKRKSYVDYTFVLDERICDGFYYASAMRVLKGIFRNPWQLDNPPAEVIPDID